MSTSFKARSILAAAIAMIFSAATAEAATTHAPPQSTATKAFSGGLAPSSGAPLLYNQTSDPIFAGILAMTNLDPGLEAFDTELADDFNVPAGGWAISVVRFGSYFYAGGTTAQPATSGNITFYYDTNTGRPGGAIPGCSHADIPLYYSEAYLTSVLTLPQVCALPQGRYWIGYSANLSFAAHEAGSYVSQQANSPNNTIVWRNPGGGYPGACTNWSAPTSCGLDSNGGMTFQLYGQTTPVTLQKFSVE
ncbi:MAG: hypothetical protein WBP11_12260 [Dokdonella sp.]